MVLLRNLLLTVLIHFSSYMYAQDRIPLNKHFYQVENPKTDEVFFTRLENRTQAGDTVVWIFDLQNRMVSQSRISINPEGNFRQEVTEYFDSMYNRTSQTILNLENSKYITAYFENGMKKGEVFKEDINKYHIWRQNPDSSYLKEYDDFKPGFNPNDLNDFYAKNLTYPLAARRSGAQGTVIVAILISGSGEAKAIELANGIQLDPVLSEEALRVVRLFKGPYTPALDLKGKPIEKWLYIPVRFKLS